MTTIIEGLREQFNDAIHTPETWEKVRTSPKKDSLTGEYKFPDFAALCRTEFCDAEVGCDCIGEPCGDNMSPRFAYMLWSNSEFLADTFVLGQMYEDELPPAVLRYLGRLDSIGQAAWLARFSASFVYFADCAALGVVPYPRCTGEEMALHILLSCVGGDIEDLDELYGDNEDFAALPEATRDLADSLRTAGDSWFEDEDVLMLFNDALDGIEGDEGITEVMGLANLQPASWFLPFRS
jgi:hypothetical protein